MSTPADEAAAYLTSKMLDIPFGLVTVFVGDGVKPVRQNDVLPRIVLANVAGLPSTPIVDGGGRTRMDRPGLFVRIEGNRDNPYQAELIADRVANLLSYAVFGSFENCVVTGSGYNRAGVNAEGRPVFTINATLQRCTPGASLPWLRGNATAVPGVVNQAFGESLDDIIQSASRYSVIDIRGMIAGDSIYFDEPMAYGVPKLWTEAGEPMGDMSFSISYTDSDRVLRAIYQYPATIVIPGRIVRVQ